MPALVPVRLVTRERRGAVLVTGATGRVGRLVVDELLRAGVPVRALTRRPEHAALPADVTSAVEEIVGSPPRTFHQWAADNAAAFATSGLPPNAHTG